MLILVRKMKGGPFSKKLKRKGRMLLPKMGKRIFTALVIVLLFFSTITPFNNPVSSAQGHEAIKRQAVVQGEFNKINKTLLAEFKEKEQVTFLVKFKEKADVKQVAQNAEKKAVARKVTPYQKELMVRSTVISELKATAAKSQEHVLEFLDKMVQEGKAKDIKSFFIVNAVAVTATKDVMEKLATFPEVEKILPNEERHLLPSSPERLGGALHNEIANTAWGIERIGAPEVWQMGINGSGIVVAAIDTGVEWDHPALKEKYRGYNPETGEVDHEFAWYDTAYDMDEPYDDEGHGTHVTGTMVGGDPDGTNVIGVAPGAKFMMVKAFQGRSATDIDLLEAGEIILAPLDRNGNPRPDMAPDVVNNSWSGGSGMDEWYRDVVQAWRAAGIVPIFAAGNADLFNPQVPGSIANPANYPDSIAVGATDSADNLASFSLLGPSPYGELKPELTAPGVGVRSSVPGGGYASYNGTSMAAPHVAGTAALLLQANSSLTVDQIEQILTETATPTTNDAYPESPNNAFGHGIVNAYEAVASVVSGLGTVKGQVMKEGVDLEPPVIEHEAPGSTFEGMPVTLEVHVSDNISIIQVQVEYDRQDGSKRIVEAHKVSGDHKNATYQATIPGEDVLTGDFVYRIKAVDFGGNETVTEDFVIPVNATPTVGYFQDFEDNIAGWTTYGINNSWEWGVPTSGPGSAYSGEKLMATDLDGTYPNDSYSALEAPPIKVPEDGQAYLQFVHWYNIETNWDYGYVWISDDDGASWYLMDYYTGTSGGWVHEEIDLNQFAGKTIRISFDLETDFSVVRDGWYLDDVRISDTSLTSIGKGNPEKGKTKLIKNTPDKTGKKGKREVRKVRPNLEKQVNVANEAKTADRVISHLPLEAKVTVLESGRSVATNPADGSYSLLHAAGDYTLLAESYGFRSSEQAVTIVTNEEVTANFVLHELPKGTISGQVTNAQTGEPIENARIFLVEDANVEPVVTDANGQYTLTAYEGTYTLKVVAPLYLDQEVEVNLEGGAQLVQNFALEPFIGYPGEIAYDDGTAENARAFYDAGNGWAVRMSLEDGAEKALVTGGLFFIDEDWPQPGGTEFQVAVYDATGPDGAPGKQIAGPVTATALRNGQWTYVDLSDLGIIVNGDFYVAFIQTDPYPNTPGLAMDENGPYAARSWKLVGGEWSQAPASEGNYMIRATVEYEINAPVLTSPIEDGFTNQQEITVEGTTVPGADVAIFNNGEEVAVVQADTTGKFTANISLDFGENTLLARVKTERGYSVPSAEVVMIYDGTSPELTIKSPKSGKKFNKEVITVTGKVVDDYLDSVTVNGTKASVQGNEYSARILLDEGENVITVVARDRAGNETVQEIKVYADFTAPVIETVKPEEDQYVRTGEWVKIEFTSESGLRATFSIYLPLFGVNKAQTTSVNELPMMEVEPGRYVGYYTATDNVKVSGAIVEVKAIDSFGNETRKQATGKLFINVDE